MTERHLLFSVTAKDCEISAFRAGGPGGQHQNKVASAVRVVHRPSGAVGVSRTDRSQVINKRLAFKRMAESKEFQLWLRRRMAWLNEQMSPGYLKIEYD